MTRRDIERYARGKLDIRTDAERDRQRINEVRYQDANPDQKLLEPTSYVHGFFTPPGFQAANTSTIAAPPSGEASGIYLGQPDTDKPTVQIRCEVATAGVTITWAELAICTAIDFNMGANVDLTLNGYTNVASVVNTTGRKEIDINVTLSRGVHVWLVWVSLASTPFALTGGLADPLVTGRYLTVSGVTTRPSTMADPTTFAPSSLASRAAWIGVQW